MKLDRTVKGVKINTSKPTRHRKHCIENGFSQLHKGGRKEKKEKEKKDRRRHNDNNKPTEQVTGNI